MKKSLPIKEGLKLRINKKMQLNGFTEKDDYFYSPAGNMIYVNFPNDDAFSFYLRNVFL